MATAAPHALLAQLTAWHKDGVQKLTSAVERHTSSLKALIEQAEAEIAELVQPFAAHNPRSKRRAPQAAKVGGAGRVELPRTDGGEPWPSPRRARRPAARGARPARARPRRAAEPHTAAAAAVSPLRAGCGG
jgi:hypothetical protein